MKYGRKGFIKGKASVEIGSYSVEGKQVDLLEAILTPRRNCHTHILLDDGIDGERNLSLDNATIEHTLAYIPNRTNCECFALGFLALVLLD